jgi:hypothetical protein
VNKQNMCVRQAAHPDQALLDLCARVAELEAVIARSWSLVTGEDGNEEPDDLDDVKKELARLHKMIVEARATTLAGFIAKAKCAHQARAGDERPPDECIDEMLVTALIRDLVVTEA